MSAPTPQTLRFAGGLEVDLAARQVRLAGTPVPMTRAEYELTAYLAARPGQVVVRALLAEQAWGHVEDPDAVTGHIRRIRAHLAPLTTISTLLGVCYRWDLPLEAGR
jgi:DNA-binding response OmpR family regulator